MAAKFNKSQILTLSLIATLLCITPLMSTSLRPTYLYFLINVLILALVFEAGLLSLSSSQKSLHHQHKLTQKTITQTSVPITRTTKSKFDANEGGKLEKFESEKIVNSVDNGVKKCHSNSSLVLVSDQGEEEGLVDDEELFAKAENFIGNFYMQLRMQTEESRNTVFSQENALK